ncbi:uncharacterized protein METZ01_LOCUS255074, partial [marine metagenome]
MTDQTVTRKQLGRKLLDQEHGNMVEAREKSARSGGRDYWRSLDELAGTEEFEIMLQREFPE